MAQNSAYDVIYEYGNKEVRRDVVIASAADAVTVTAVLTSNGRTHPSGAIKIISIRNSLAVPQGVILS